MPMQALENTFYRNEAKSITKILEEFQAETSLEFFIKFGQDNLRDYGVYYYVDIVELQPEYLIKPLAKNLFTSTIKQEALFAEYYYIKELIGIQQKELKSFF